MLSYKTVERSGLKAGSIRNNALTYVNVSHATQLPSEVDGLQLYKLKTEGVSSNNFFVRESLEENCYDVNISHNVSVAYFGMGNISNIIWDNIKDIHSYHKLGLCCVMTINCDAYPVVSVKVDGLKMEPEVAKYFEAPVGTIRLKIIWKNTWRDSVCTETVSLGIDF